MKRTKKYIAPVIIVLLLCAYYLAFAIIIGRLPELSVWVRLAAIVLPLAVCGVLLYVLIERVREIRDGEEDDLENY